MLGFARTVAYTAASLTLFSMATSGIATASESSDVTPSAVTCDAPDGTIEVYPPAQNPDGSYVGVASYDGNGQDYVPMIKEDVSFAPDPEVGRASGQADGSNVLIPADIPDSGNYYTVVYYGNDYCQSQPVPLP